MFQMFLQKGTGGLNLSSVQMAQGNTVQQGGSLSMQGQVVSAGPLQNSIQQQQHAVQPQSQQQTPLREQNTALTQVRKNIHVFFPNTATILILFLVDFLKPCRHCHSLWLCVFQSQRSSVTLQHQQNPLPASLYNTMMIPQQSPTNVVQIATSLAQNTGPNTPAVATFAQDRGAQIRFAHQ